MSSSILAPDESREPASQDYSSVSVAVSRACADLRPTIPKNSQVEATVY